MKRYKYLTLRLDFGKSDKELNKYGTDGWRIIHVEYEMDDAFGVPVFLYHFEKEIE